MTTHKKPKDCRLRGSTSHGYGSMKKHRGAGSRGGRGRAGSGKRGDQNKPATWKNKNYFGKYGFTSRSRTPSSFTINIKSIEDRAETFIKKGLAKLKNDFLEINLADIGYNKLLSTGKPKRKLLITTMHATEKAIEKIKAAGGEVKLTSQKPDKKKDEEAAPVAE
ncbi:uL15 family ribosomal protein [Candidatus Woesearchaeota archaeon]|nr:uL15 family ribosomal protein [Candidatus Woesearchaeota archaeon]